MKRNSILLVSAVFLLAAASLFAASAPKMVIEYFENNSGSLYVRAGDGTETEAADITFGDELAVGSTLITLQGDYAELRLVPNGTIVRVAENTNFAVKSVQGKDGATKNAFAMAVGKVKTVAAKSKGAVYSFEGNTAVCGVRGTKFIFSVLPGQRELAYVLEGLVDFSNQAGQTLALQAGMAADALASSFASFTPPAGLLEELEGGMQFQQLSEEEVSKGEAVVPETAKTEGAEAPQAKSQTPKWLQRLMDFLGMEIGTVTLEGETWAKAVIQPRFAIGKLKAGLYLPIIYKSDMFDSSDWYHPLANGERNDEWSFGTDKSGWDNVTVDILNDLFLKIRYIEWGEQRDPFFFKFGNLGDITMGHGSIMRRYANDLDFPAVRKLGLNLGLDGKQGGLEAMISDAADPQIFGIRPYWKPGGGIFALGFTALTDLNPEQIAYGGTAAFGDPVFLNGGLDAELAIVNKDALAIVLYTDAAAMLPFFREPVGSVDTGFALDAIWFDGRPRNFGAMAGVLGNILMIDYRLEFRYSDGIFTPAFYGPLYDRESPDRVTQLAAYLADPNDQAYDVQSMGVYGELGFTLERVFYIKGGYYWPWPADPVDPLSAWPDDTLHLELGILKGLLPLYGSISLDRVGIAAPQIRINNGSSEEFNFFDGNLRFTGEIVYPFSPLLEFALQATTNVVGGNVYPSISILTRLNG